MKKERLKIYKKRTYVKSIEIVVLIFMTFLASSGIWFDEIALKILSELLLLVLIIASWLDTFLKTEQVEVKNKKYFIKRVKE